MIHLGLNLTLPYQHRLDRNSKQRNGTRVHLSIGLMKNLILYLRLFSSDVYTGDNQPRIFKKRLLKNGYSTLIVQFAIDIQELYYLYHNSLFDSIDLSTVRNIQMDVITGKYTLEPLTVETDPDTRTKGYKELYKGSWDVRPTQKDNLVLTALASALRKHFDSTSILLNKSFSPLDGISSHTAFYSKLISRGKVKELYYWNLMDSLKCISRSHLLRKLELFVHDKFIVGLVSSFLELPIYDSQGVDWAPPAGVGIPPVKHITSVLINFLLDDLDREVVSCYPFLYYDRYLYDTFISINPPSSFEAEEVEELVIALFDYLHIDGELHIIKPGDKPIPCLGGFVRLTPECDINYISTR